MTRFVHSIRVPALTALLTLILATGTAFAQSTTSSLRVVVTDETGAAVADVPVAVTHIPTGRTQVAETNSSGVVNLRGMAVGGPYEVGLASGSNYNAATVQDVYLQLDDTEVIPLSVRSGAIEEIVVMARQVATNLAVGVGRDFDRDRIEAVPSVNRDFVSTLATDPKILVDNSVARGPAVSMAGQNFRFNSVTIDGVAQNDNFGLSTSGPVWSFTTVCVATTIHVQSIDVGVLSGSPGMMHGTATVLVHDDCGQPACAVKPAGRYVPRQIDAFHNSCAEHDLPYELW